MNKVRLIGLIPILLLVVGPVFANSVEPYVLGMPFLLFYILIAVLLTSVCMTVLYLLDPKNKEEMDS
ncbi:DUF3311 domain-containing protein [Priestia koreensis]|uniref:DUF3311 domain-containing protein n=1 Tax=Priestia koreensis TaxID=284581 RepID=UPI0020420945|nr:DUF3311 domain-containing protein [Priestia koreensis]MCM3004173.1 DUF3311 domain-containing protein [Priestia koreensis]